MMFLSGEKGSRTYYLSEKIMKAQAQGSSAMQSLVSIWVHLF